MEGTARVSRSDPNTLPQLRSGACGRGSRLTVLSTGEGSTARVSLSHL